MNDASAKRWFYICDRCGNLVTIEAAPLHLETEPWVCDECGSDALWQFTDEKKAMEHSAMIRAKVRS